MRYRSETQSGTLVLRFKKRHTPSHFYRLSCSRYDSLWDQSSRFQTFCFHAVLGALESIKTVCNGSCSTIVLEAQMNCTSKANDKAREPLLSVG